MLRQSSNTGRRTSIDRRERIVDLSKSLLARSLILTIEKSMLNDFIKRYRSGKGLEDQLRSGRSRKTTRRIDWLIKRKSAVDINKTASEIVHELHEEGLANINHSTMIRHLHEVGPFGRSGTKRSFISRKNQKAWIEDLRMNTYIGQSTIGKMWHFLMNQNLIFSKVTEDNMWDVLLVKIWCDISNIKIKAR